MNILWIDRWSKQLGLAYTKAWIVLPWGVLANDGELYFAIADWVARHQINQVVVGYPKGNKLTTKIDKFILSLGVMVECPIDMVDEHYTTVMAQEILWDYSKQKWFDDCIAAMQIVERYLRIISQD